MSQFSKDDVINFIKQHLIDEDTQTVFHHYFSSETWYATEPLVHDLKDAEAEHGFTVVNVVDNLEGEGGPSEQDGVCKITLTDTGEVFYLTGKATWVSWDGFYYANVEDTIKEVYPVQVITTQYVTQEPHSA